MAAIYPARKYQTGHKLANAMYVAITRELKINFWWYIKCKKYLLMVEGGLWLLASCHRHFKACKCNGRHSCDIVNVWDYLKYFLNMNAVGCEGGGNWQRCRSSSIFDFRRYQNVFVLKYCGEGIKMSLLGNIFFFKDNLLLNKHQNIFFKWFEYIFVWKS